MPIKVVGVEQAEFVLFLLTLGGMVMTHSAYLYQTTGAMHQWRVLISGFVIIIDTLSLFCGLVLSQIQKMIRGIEEDRG